MEIVQSASLIRLRLTGFAEAISWILLLVIAMPLKYIFHIPEVVKVVGWLHGLLFILYILQLFYQKIILKWPFQKFAMGCLFAFLPFGTLVFDKQLKSTS